MTRVSGRGSRETTWKDELLHKNIKGSKEVHNHVSKCFARLLVIAAVHRKAEQSQLNPASQRLRYPLIPEYSINHIRDPTMV